jgi:hypothetical protein
MRPNPLGPPTLLRDARVYLSGPMDFVASRADEKKHGWRNRVGQFLAALGVTVFDPWTKPEIRGLHQYGREDEKSNEPGKLWTFASGRAAAKRRATCAAAFWPMLHVDLRMVDTSDFVVCYCPTNIYSVGTPHEIILCRQQRKPVLFVSPAVDFPALGSLRTHLTRRRDGAGLMLLKTLEAEVPIKPNPEGVPSLWYLPLVGAEHFFDGFGFSRYRRLFGWPRIALDDHERRYPPRKPLLPFLRSLNRRLPKQWDRARRRFTPNDDWLFWDLTRRTRSS